MYSRYIEKCFPNHLIEDIKTIEKTLNLNAEYQPYMPFEISIDGNNVVMPMRIYTDEMELNNLDKLTKIQKEIVYCFYSRHYDGYIREKCLRQIIKSNSNFVSAFILQLLGEYVIEIIEVIYNNRQEINMHNLILHINENSNHYEITKQRVYSYWDCFYRGEYVKYKAHVKPKGKTYLDYPGIKTIKYINKFLSNKSSNK